jgi:branched chain amino acid efflux pump
VSGQLREGIRVGLGLAAGSFVLAVTFGGLARSAGWGVTAPIAASCLIFSGSAQFALASTLGGGVLPAIAAAALLNARFVPMALAAGPSFHGGRLRRAIEAQTVNDGSWAFAHLGGGHFDRARMIGATLPQWPAWVAGTALGVLMAPSASLTSSLGLDVVFPAFFLVLLLDEVRTSNRSRALALTSAAVAAVLTLIFPAGLVVLLSTLTVLTVVSITDRR